MRKVELLPTHDCEAGYGPEPITIAKHLLCDNINSYRKKQCTQKKLLYSFQYLLMPL